MSIEAVSLALPSVVHTAAMIAGQTGADRSFIADKIGLRERHVLGPEESGVSLAARACEDLFATRPWLRSAVQLLVFVTQTPDRGIPHNAPQLAQALGLPSDLASFDLALGCSGYAYGLEVTLGFMERAGTEHALLVTCDPYSRLIDVADRDTNCVFGDAATATWLRRRHGRSRMLAHDFGTDGQGSSAIEIRQAGAPLPQSASDAGGGVAGANREGPHLRMQGRSVYNFVLDRIPGSIATCVRRAGLTTDDIDLFVLHPGSRFMLDALVRKAGLDPDRVPFNMDRIGNVVSSSIPALLAELDGQGRLGQALVLMSGFGVGLSWATSLWRFDPSSVPPPKDPS